MKKIALGLAVAAAAITLTSCKQIDESVTGTKLVAGTTNLSRFCDGPVLIYFSNWSGADDQYEWFWPGGCAFDGKQWNFADRPPTGAVPNGDSTDNE